MIIHHRREGGDIECLRDVSYKDYQVLSPPEIKERLGQLFATKYIILYYKIELLLFHCYIILACVSDFIKI